MKWHTKISSCELLRTQLRHQIKLIKFSSNNSTKSSLKSSIIYTLVPPEFLSPSNKIYFISYQVVSNCSDLPNNNNSNHYQQNNPFHSKINNIVFHKSYSLVNTTKFYCCLPSSFSILFSFFVASFSKLFLLSWRYLIRKANISKLEKIMKDSCSFI